MRTGWIAFRAARWPALVMLGNAVVIWKIERFGNALGEQAQIQLAALERYLLVGSWALGLTWLAANLWRLYQWEQGRAAACDLCAGPLGWTLPGKRVRGRQLSDYAQCWSCGRNRPVE